MTETLTELQNANKIALETCLAGIALEETHQILQSVKLHAEMEFEQVLKPVMTESQSKILKNAILIALALRTAGLVQGPLVKSQYVILFVETAE